MSPDTPLWFALGALLALIAAVLSLPALDAATLIDWGQVLAGPVAALAALLGVVCNMAHNASLAREARNEENRRVRARLVAPAAEEIMNAAFAIDRLAYGVRSCLFKLQPTMPADITAASREVWDCKQSWRNGTVAELIDEVVNCSTSAIDTALQEYPAFSTTQIRHLSGSRPGATINHAIVATRVVGDFVRPPQNPTTDIMQGLVRKGWSNHRGVLLNLFGKCIEDGRAMAAALEALSEDLADANAQKARLAFLKFTFDLHEDELRAARTPPT